MRYQRGLGPDKDCGLLTKEQEKQLMNVCQNSRRIRFLFFEKALSLQGRQVLEGARVEAERRGG